MSKGKFYMTTAIAYASGKPHIGNTYEAVLADSIARFKRKDGYDVFFQTGTDEHGQKIELKAAEAGVTPQEYVDKASAEIKRIWDLPVAALPLRFGAPLGSHVPSASSRLLSASCRLYRAAFKSPLCKASPDVLSPSLHSLFQYPAAATSDRSFIYLQ